MSTVGTRLGLGWALGALVVWASPAGAQPVDTAEPAAATPAGATAADLGMGGLPGGARVGSAEVLPSGVFAAAFEAGAGFRNGLLASNHKMRRGTAGLGLAYGITPWLSASLYFDGRYDTHRGGGELTDNGWVGEPRLAVRAARALGSVSLAGQLSAWAPGADAPSLVPSAISVEARAILGARQGALRWALNGGGRLDNGAKSIDMPGALTLADQASLGVSDFHSVFVGGRGAYALGDLVLGLDANADVYLGDGAPGMRVATYLTADYPIAAGWDLTGQVGTHLFSKPTIAMDGTIPLVPYDPQLAFGVGLVGRFGGAGRAAPTAIGDGGGGTEVTPPAPKTATISGVVTDETGAPLAGAKVTIVVGDQSVEVITDERGAYRAADLPLGTAEITIESEGRVARTERVELTGGDAPAPSVQLEPVPPPTRFLGLVRSFRGTGVAAKITVNPGGLTVTATATGEFEIELPAGGSYEVTVEAAGFVTQTRTIQMNDRGNTLYNFDLRTP